MNLTDPIADMLTRIRNAQSMGKTNVRIPASRLKLEIARLLKDEGYVSEVVELREGEHKRVIDLTLKYYRGTPVIERLERISRPGLRRFSQVADLPKVMNGLGIAIISTSKGLMTDIKAREAGLGGEVLCLVA
jgi:small subunit ribosomal protein S8